MSHIIQPTKEFVKRWLDPKDLSQKDAKLQEKLSARLLELYEEINILFIGTPYFALPILEELCQTEFKPVAVITAPDKPAGRGQQISPPPVKTAAQKHQIPVFQPTDRDELIKQALSIQPSLIIVAAYGKILPKEILEFPKYGSVNIHPSLLPKYRGPSPIQFAILNGDKKTGVTIMLMNEKMDEGPILSQEELDIEDDETTPTLEEKLSKTAAKLLVKTLNFWLLLKESPKSVQHLIIPQQQDHTQATYTKILTKSDGKIYWDKSADELDRQIRALTPWPGNYAILEAKSGTENTEEKKLTLKILKAKASKTQTEKELGEIFLTDNGQLAVQTGNNCLIMEELQLEGGKPMSAKDFLNGHSEIIGTILQ